MSESWLRVPDTSCEACRRTIGGGLSPMPVVVRVGVDLATKVVTIDADRAPLKRLVEAIEDQCSAVARRDAA
jgi:copper chaperone CopZ